MSIYYCIPTEFISIETEQECTFVGIPAEQCPHLAEQPDRLRQEYVENTLKVYYGHGLVYCYYKDANEHNICQYFRRANNAIIECKK